MHLKTVALALAYAGTSAALSGRQDAPDNTTESGPIARSFIIEYASGKAHRRDGLASNDDITIVKSFDTNVFIGATIETDSYNLESLSALPDVARVWPNEKVYFRPSEAKVTDELPSGQEYLPHNVTGVSKLHEQGIFGKGAKVGVVDTGIWYKHPALGGGIGKGFKVAGGYDFVGDGNWPGTEKEPDSDPEDVLGHGTHVAGIVAGKTDGWIGVAPDATIYAYKVFARQDYTDSATLIDAFLRAYEDGVDIITSSIGYRGGWSSNAWGVVASRLVDEGLIVTISAGNDGEDGPANGSAGASGENVIAVASVENDKVPTFPFNATFVEGEETETATFGYLPSTNFFPSSIVDWPIVPLAFNTSDPAEACTAYPEDSHNLTGVIPLVRRGTCTFETKQGNLKALGAEYILFYNNEADMITPFTNDIDGLIGLTTAEVGAAIIKTVKAGGNVTADFSLNPEDPVAFDNPAGSLLDYFTQWGPLYDLYQKPDIAAPGGNIFSTYLDDSYAVMSGTSMACPYVAGIAALYIGANGGRSVHGKGFGKELSKRIISSGVSIPWYVNSEKADFPASVAQAGNGLVNGFKVVNYTTALQYEKFNLNDTANFQGDHDIVVTNNGRAEVTYKLTAENAGGLEILGLYPTYAEGVYARNVKKQEDLVPKDFSVEVDLPEEFTLGPGDSKTVSVKFQNPEQQGWNATSLPLYSGKVIVSSSLGEQLSIPYLGIGASLREELDTIYAQDVRSVSSIQRSDIFKKPYWTFNLSLSTQDFPKVYAAVTWGTRQVRWDIFDKDWDESQWTFPLTPGEDGYVGPAAYWVGSGVLASYFDPRRYDPNDTLTYPIVDVSHNTVGTSNEYWWFGKLGNGSQIELGNYTMRFASLKPFGNPQESDDWDIFKTPEIAVLGKY
ncbi:serine endopeptidase [Fusarium albosuccineum]|uniref:Serine endopeptidase n=1 Tax=Fusarium albosuccineum TaxID=1237068 RepID=A0A8H4LFH7_9HYPO|nr:serine endopeptidase [Fusarium albosuccineum]